MEHFLFVVSVCLPNNGSFPVARLHVVIPAITGSVASQLLSLWELLLSNNTLTASSENFSVLKLVGAE